MALFTNEEAANCTILKCESLKKNGTHQAWCVCVEDSEGKKYNWIDSTTPENATNSGLKSAIKTHLMNVINKRVPTTTATAKAGLAGSKLS